MPTAKTCLYYYICHVYINFTRSLVLYAQYNIRFYVTFMLCLCHIYTILSILNILYLSMSHIRNNINKILYIKSKCIDGSI